MGMVRLEIHGNLTRDPERGETKNGKAVTNFTVACNQYRGRDSEEKTHYVRVSAYGPQADTVAACFKKGQGIICWGKGDLHAWNDKNDNSARAAFELTLEGWDFAGSAPKAGEGEAAPAAAPEKPTEMVEEDDEELLF